MSTQKLLPCFVCGGEARLNRDGYSLDLRVRCDECGARTEDFETDKEAIAAWNRRSPPAAPVAFDPLEGGCPQCEWLDTNLGRVLDKKCDLHQRIEDLQVSLDLEKQVRQNSFDMLRRVCEVIRADVDDDPVVVAQARMDEIRALEDEASPPAAVPEGLMDALKSAEKVLRPFFNAVFNDNGDMTVHGGYRYHEAVAGYWAYKRVRDAISAAPAAPTEAPNE